MRQIRHLSPAKHTKHSQKGIVIFIALAALVIMSLAAVALIRSVDTNSLIAGNLSFKQTAVMSSSYGLESATAKIGPQAITWGDINRPTEGYYATCNQFNKVTSDGDKNACNGLDLVTESKWIPGTTSQLADGVGFANGLDPYGNQVQYIVERMCRFAGSITNPDVKRDCLIASSDPDSSGKNIQNEPLGNRPDQLSDATVYRMTIKLTGPKNTVSYIQTFIY